MIQQYTDDSKLSVILPQIIRLKLSWNSAHPFFTFRRCHSVVW